MSPPDRHTALHTQLRTLLAEWGVEPALLQGNTHSLIRSGALDSAGLFNLSLWIESQIGQPIDPGRVDVVSAWDSIEAIAAFILGEPALTCAPAPTVIASASGYAIERYRNDNDDLDAVARLFSHLWSPDVALNRRVFEWKYLTNPQARDPLIYLVRHGGEVVAMRALCETRWLCAGCDAPVSVYCADDLIIDPAHRNQGLYAHLHAQALRDLADRGQKFFISLSALRVARMQSLASGAHAVPIGPVLGRRSARARFADALESALSRVPLVWRAAKPLARCLDGAHNAATAFARLDALAPSGAVQVSRTAPVAAMAALAAAMPHDGRIRHARDEAFLRWRYAAPLHEYRFVSVERGGAPVAYLVLGRALSTSANARRVHVVDWATRDAQDAGALNQALALCVRVGGFDELVTWGDTSHRTWSAALAAQRFAPTDQHQTARGLPCILVHNVNPNADELRLSGRSVLTPEDWDLRLVDTSYA